MLNLKEQEVEQLYNWKKKYMLKIDKIVDMVKKDAPKAYEHEEFQQSIEDLKDSINKYSAEKEKIL